MQDKLTCGEVFLEAACFLEKLLKMSLAEKNSIHGGVAAHLEIVQFNVSSCTRHNSEDHRAKGCEKLMHPTANVKKGALPKECLCNGCI